MNGVLSASKLMTAAEVRKECAEAMDSPAMIFAEEMRRKRQLSEMNRKVSN